MTAFDPKRSFTRRISGGLVWERKTMRFIRSFCFGVFLLAVSACATGPSLKESAHALPSIESGKGRIFFYRTIVIGAAYTPDVLLNGAKVGNAVPRGVFFKDVSPGKYAVTTTMTSEIVNIDMAAGEKKYIKLNYALGFRIYPELVDTATGEAEASELSLITDPGR
jgi:Protein of unknown function (DUF2846)